MTYYLKAKQFFLESGLKGAGFLEVNQGKFGKWVEDVDASETVVDYSGLTIAPGLFDTHIHGINGFDIMDGTTEAVHEISKSLLPLGVTRFLPTSLTSSKADLEQAILSVKTAVDQGLTGAQSAGIFLEGPFFTEKYKGAQNPAYFLDPNMADFDKWQELANGSIVKIALAPERVGAMDFISEVTAKGVKVALGHTDASFDCCGEALTHGANIFVHLFNGMSGLHHRNPGVAGAALIHDNAFAEIICDGHHVRAEVAAFAYQNKKDKLTLITDCMRAGLLDDGDYKLGEFDVEMKQGVARIKDVGALAGSTLILKEGVKNLSRWAGAPLNEIWQLASLAPAQSLGMADQYGSIATGKVADFVVMDDQLDIAAVAIAGEIKYKK